jgi:Flp pilus assembly protein TadG
MRTGKTFIRDRRGSAMLEFTLLAPVFFLVVAGITEFVLYQFKVNALNQIVYEATRNLQTGEVQTAGNAAAQRTAFDANVCAEADWLMNCADIDFDVRNFNTLAAVTFPTITYDAGGRPVGFVFQPGGPNRYTVVRATMQYTFITPYLRELMGLAPGLPAAVSSSIVVKNEPWA